jgi:hypothetical protein
MDKHFDNSLSSSDSMRIGLKIKYNITSWQNISPKYIKEKKKEEKDHWNRELLRWNYCEIIENKIIASGNQIFLK